MLPVCLFAALLAPPGAWSIEVLEGSGALNPTHLVVQVKDPQGHPASSITVVFRLPVEGPSGSFASGLRSESVLTGPDGKAEVRGIQWNSTPGKLDILVRAQSAEISVPAEISAQMPASRHFEAKTGRKKWVIFAVVCGASAASFAVVGGHKNTVSATAVVPTPLPPPTLGSPVISIGKP